VKRDWWEVFSRLAIMLHCGTQAVLQQLEEDEVQMGGEAGERLQAPVQLYHIKGTRVLYLSMCISMEQIAIKRSKKMRYRWEGRQGNGSRLPCNSTTYRAPNYLSLYISMGKNSYKDTKP
jgi:hypothetical protein